MSLTERWQNQLERLRHQGRYRRFTPPSGIDFSSNDYLGYAGRRGSPGLASSPPLPVSGTSSRLLRGHHPIWDEIETSLARWHGAEAAVMMTSGYSANEGLLSTVIEPRDLVFSDRLNHACIHDGVRLARPRVHYRFRHNDLDDLEKGLRDNQSVRGERFILTESLFSMDGDRAPLLAMAELAGRYGASLIVDEAHATGCFGEHGSGLVDALGLRTRVLATMHTGGKALAVPGAYLVGSQLPRELLINRCRHLIFTTAMPPQLGAWWRTALNRVQSDHEGRQLLQERVRQFRSRVPSCPGEDFIVPVLLGADERAVAVAAKIQEQGLDVRAVRPPSVPEGTARLRISLHADHDPAELDQLAEIVNVIRE